MNKTILEIEKAVDQHKEDLNFNKFLNELFRIFNKLNLEGSKQLLNLSDDKKPYNLIEKFEKLTFYDGVILVQDLFERIITDYFDENDKDIFGLRYDLSLIDKMNDILSNEVLNKIENLRREHLHELFILKSDKYKCPVWMQKK